MSALVDAKQAAAHLRELLLTQPAATGPQITHRLMPTLQELQYALELVVDDE